MLSRQISASVADEENQINAYELSEETLEGIESILKTIDEKIFFLVCDSYEVSPRRRKHEKK